MDTDPLYVNFTSGSTGTPKGVTVCHRSVIDFIETLDQTFGIKKEDVIGNQAPFDFDVSVKDIFSGLYTGAEVVIIPREYFSNPTLLMDYLCDHHITVLIWAVSAMCFVSIMYAHYMKNGEGRMFTALNNYADQSYYDGHKTIIIDTPTALYHMEVVAGIETTGTGDYIQLSFASSSEFLEYVKGFVDQSTFKSDVTVGENDQLITLSTCSPNQYDGRYALIGKLVKVQDYDK